ncbi:MAG: hypothetical protein E7434_06000 [Ruminococcaceae bacterium]|nr:hypothetical protein [Oscillospiraceae bacterium]
MKALNGNFGLRPNNSIYTAYSKWEVYAAIAMLYVAPFVTPMLTLIAFLIFAIRIVLYDAKVFAADYALLTPIAPLFSFNDMSLLIYLGLLAAAWHFFTKNICKQMLYGILLLLLNYLILRMPWNISGFVLCFGQLFMLCILLPMQDASSAQFSAKIFSLSLILSSAFALVMRDSSVLYVLRGSELPAFWGSTLNRFHGLFEDPNYYMTLIVTGMTLLIKLLDTRQIKLVTFVIAELSLAVFGVLTYSKTFFLAMIALIIIGIIWLFVRKKYAVAITFTVIIVLAVVVLLITSSVFSVLLFRLSSAGNLSDLTTGRSEVFAAYYRVITENAVNTLFGVGMGASNLGKDPHNLYLEITYYLGVVGLVLIIALFVALTVTLGRKRQSVKKQSVASKYLVLVMALSLHLTLHGIFSVISYAVFFFAFLSMQIETPQQEA